MNLLLTNPAGLWALLGIPAVLAIHLLQRQPRHIPISTRFLLEHTRNESIEGRRIERLRASIPLWLQLLVVLLITWLLVGPRWQRADSIQRTAIVIDSSASMQAFKPQLLTELPGALSKLSTHSRREELVVIDSTLHNEPLYHGKDKAALMARLDDWQPLQGAHDFTPALEIARSLVGSTGSIILASDHAIDDLPFNTRLLAVGEKTPNVGFTGFRLVDDQETGKLGWRALVRNYSDTPQERQWTIRVGGQSQPAQSLSLEPGQTLTLSGPFPTGVDQFVLALKPDTFPLDDQLPVLRPLAKQLTINRAVHPDHDALVDQVLASLSDLTPAPSSDGPADLAIVSYDPLNPTMPDHAAIVAVRDPLGRGKTLQGEIVAAHDTLTEGLGWQGLIARSTLQIPLLDSDDVLLWQGERPLIFRRRLADASQLIFNFDLTASNAVRLPAFIVLVSRFVEQVRATKVAPTRLNAETNQPLAVAADSDSSQHLILRWKSPFGDGSKNIPLHQLATLRAPQAPGTFQLIQDGTMPPLVLGTTFFADTREADLSQATSIDTIDALTPTLVRQHTRRDPYWQIWIALAGLVILLNWHFTSRPTS